MRAALCTGINDYPGNENDLGGCVNDARDWQARIASLGYTTDLLLDGEVTHANVVGRLQALIEQARLGDHIVFTYSGHGTWVPDKDGDEADGRDEAMCLYDFQSGGLLIDDEINRIFGARRRGVRVTILSDSCHSGTVLKAFQTPGAEKKPKFISPAAIDAIPVNEERAIEMEERVAFKPSRATALLISGCADTEYSYDANFGGRANGAFTYFALQALQTNPKTYAGWFRAIRALLPSGDYPQSPQLGATAYQRYTRPFA